MTIHHALAYALIIFISGVTTGAVLITAWFDRERL